MKEILTWMLGRGDRERGAELLDEVRELYRERRARGRAAASLRAAWDIAALTARPALPIPGEKRGSTMTRSLNDLKGATRSIVRRPGVSLAVAGMLSLGLGLAMLTFTLVNELLLTPLPYANPRQLVAVYTEFRPESGYTYPRFSASGIELADFDRESALVEAAAYLPLMASLADGSEGTERMPAARMTSKAFQLLGVAPIRGSAFTAEQDAAGAPCSVMLSHGLWRDRFGGRDDITSSPIRIDGQPCRVTGVMPEGFAFPTEQTRFWLPLPVEAAPDGRGNHGYLAIGRITGGHSFDEAETEVAAMMARWSRDLAHHKGHGFRINGLQEDVLGDVRPSLFLLMGAALLVLIVVCANVSNMLLAHGEARTREFAVRTALGAGRASLVRQVIFEGALLAAAGAAAGGLLAWVGLDALIAAYPGTLPRASDIAIGGAVVAAGAALAILTGAAIAVLPAIRLSRSRPTELRERSGSSRFGLAAQRWLVITELALSAAVTVGALLLAQSFMRLQRMPMGFEPAGVTVMQVGLPGGPSRPSARVTDFYASLVDGLQRTPGVEHAGAISSVPLLQSPPPDLFAIEGRPVGSPNEPGPIADYVMATPGALEALGMRLRRGRMLSASDNPAQAPVAVINETLARTYWGDRDPLGQRFRYPGGVRDGQFSDWGPWITIVGVTDDIRSIRPNDPPRPALYVAHAQRPREFYQGRTMGVLIRSTGTSASAAALVRAAVRAGDSEASISIPRTLQDALGVTVARPRFLGWIMSIFAAVSLLIASLGVYAVVAYAVERRTREIGIRMALGATASGIARMIGRQTALMLAAGLVAGLVGAVFLARWMSTLLFGVTPMHLPTYALVAGLLAATVVAAALIPARRAARVDPLVALRAE